MMKRRWSNNGGFAALRMFEDSSPEVTSSSNGLVLTAGLNMSPSSLDSPDFGENDLWPCNEPISEFNPHQHSVISSANGCSSLPGQTTIIPLPQLPNPTNPHTSNANELNNVTQYTYSLGSVISDRLNNFHGNFNGPNVGNGIGSLQTSPLSSVGSASAHSQHSPPNGHAALLSAATNMAVNLATGHLNTNGIYNGMQHTPRSDSANSISSGKLQTVKQVFQKN